MLMQQIICADGVIRTKLDIAIQRFQSFEPPEGYYLAFSGGKDSQCIYHLAKMAGVKFDAHYNVTSVDPPELIYFIREHYPDVIFDYPRDEDGKRITMWNLIVKNKMPPTMFARYCCQALKESQGKRRITVTGVRWAESTRRRDNQDVVNIQNKPKSTRKLAEDVGASYRLSKNKGVILNDDNDPSRRMVEQCYRTQKTLVNPIVDWEDDDVWDFLNNVVKVPHCCLYDEGFKRLGCIGCPLSGKKNQKKGFERYPKYKQLYLKAFNRMLKWCIEHNEILRNQENGEWETAEDVMCWWIEAPENKKDKEDER